MRSRWSPLLTLLLAACGGAEVLTEAESAIGVRTPNASELISRGDLELRMNKIDLLALLMEGEIDASDLDYTVFEDELLLSDTTACNRRTVKLKDMLLELPIDATDLQLSVVESLDDRVLLEIDAPRAMATATVQYVRRKIDNGCLTPGVWSDRKEASLTATVRGFSGFLDLSIYELNGKIRIRDIYRADLEFGDVEMYGTSTNQLEEWLLQVVGVFGSWDGLVNLGLELVTRIEPIQNMLEEALEGAFDQAFGFETAVGVGDGSVEVTGELVDLNVGQGSLSLDLDYEMTVVEASACAGGLSRAEAGEVVLRRSSGASDFNVFLPRQLVADAVYSGLRAGTLCLPLNLGPVTVYLRPSGQLVVSTGPVVNGSASFHFEVPAELLENGAVRGQARVAIDILPVIDASGQLVATNLNPPQLTMSGTLLGVTRTPLNLANYQTVAQAILNNLYPAGRIQAPLMPRAMDFGNTGYQLRVDEVRNSGSELRVGLDLFLPDNSGSSSGGGWAGGDGPTDDDEVPSFLPGFEVVPAELRAPNYDESRGDLGDEFNEEFRDQGL